MDISKFPAGLRVLAIDDDRATLLILKRQLQHCNYNDVTTVTEAEMALGMLRERRDREDQFDLVISDVAMTSTDGFRLLELIRQEMDIPVIILSGNEKIETMMKGIKHGACDYLVKPAHMEQVRNLWMHVVRKKTTDSKNNVNDGKRGANHTKKDSNNNKKEGYCAEEDNEEGTSTQKRQRMKWSKELHNKFVEAINIIGIDRVVPKTILEAMGVDGLSRESVASHLQKYRIYLRNKLSEGTLSHSIPFVDEPQEWLSDQRPADTNRLYASQGFPSGSSSSSSANISNGVVFSTSRPLYSGTSSANISNGSSPSAMGMHLPSSHSWSSYASILRGKMLEANKGIPFDADTFFEEIKDGGMPEPSIHLPVQKSPELANQHSLLIQPSSTGPSNQVSTESQFAGLCNTNSSWRFSVPSSYPNIGHSVGTSISAASQGNSVSINQLSRFAATSSHVPTFGNEYQNQQIVLGLGGTTPMLPFSEQMSPFNFGSAVVPNYSSALGSSSSGGPTLANLQIENSTMQTHATGNLPTGGTIDQYAVSDQVNNNNELPAGTSAAQDAGAVDDVGDFWSNWF